MQVGKIVIKKANPWRQLEKFPESMQESMKTQLEEKLLLLNETSEQYLKEYFVKILLICVISSIYRLAFFFSLYF